MAKEPGEPKEEQEISDPSIESLTDEELVGKIRKLKGGVDNFRPNYPEIDLDQPELGQDFSDDTIGEGMETDMKECLKEYKKRTGKDFVFEKEK